MYKSILSLSIFLLSLISCHSQIIEMTKVFGGYQYSQNDENLSMGGLVAALEMNSEALSLIKKARNKTNLTTAIGLVGGICVGAPVGVAIGGGEANWALAGIGAGLIVIGIPIANSANKQAKEAVEIYNASLNANSFFEHSPQFKLHANANGLGLMIRF